MKVITAHVPLDLAGRVDDLAERLQRSRGWIVKQALAAWVAKQDFASAEAGFAEAAQTFDVGTRQDDPVTALKNLRKTTTLGDIAWRELRDAGRR